MVSRKMNLIRLFDLAPGSLGLFGSCHAFAGVCFVVFGFIYLVLLQSWYMFAANLFFGLAVGMSWLFFQRAKEKGLAALCFLLIVYVGLLNVATNIGVGHAHPMIYWGLATSIAAAFTFQLPGILIWMFLGLIFMPLTYLLRETVIRERGISLSIFQDQVLDCATYTGLLGFLAFTVYLFSKKLTATLNELNDKKADVEHLLRVVCHDLAGPTTVLNYQATALRSRPSAEGYERILRAGQKIENILDEVRYYTSLSAGRMDLRGESVDVTDALKVAISDISDIAQKKGIKIRVELQSGNIPMVLFNRDNLINQIFGNLLSNAIKFSRPYGEVFVSLGTSEAEVLVTIEDFGVGIPAEMLGNIFSIHASRSTLGTRGETGTGFGLPIVKTYLEKYGSKISIESRTSDATTDGSSGTKVHFTLRKA